MSRAVECLTCASRASTRQDFRDIVEFSGKRKLAIWKPMAGMQDVDGMNPPPSTLAAQIVEDHTRIGGHGHPQNSATFTQLLDELRSYPNELPDVASNYKLVSVVAQAGLHVAPVRDPFGNHDDATKQALACLEIIALSFGRCPEVLFFCDPNLASDGFESQLWRWIPPRLLLAMTDRSNVRLRECALNLLRTFHDNLVDAPRHWSDARLLLQSYQICADGVLTAMHNTSPVSRPILDITLPSLESNSVISPDMKQPLTLRKGCHTSISTLTQAFAFSTSTIELICQISFRHSSSGFQPNSVAMTWAVDAVKSLSSLFTKFSTILDRTYDGISSFAECIEAMMVVSDAVIKVSPNPRIGYETSLCLLDGVVNAVSLPRVIEDSKIVDRISNLLGNIAQLCSMPNYHVEEASVKLGYALSRIEGRSETGNSMLGIQDAISNCLDDIRKVIDMQHARSSLKNQTLNGLLTKSPDSNNINFLRPPKRAKYYRKTREIQRKRSEQIDLKHDLSVSMGFPEADELALIERDALQSFENLSQDGRTRVLEIICTMTLARNEKRNGTTANISGVLPDSDETGAGNHSLSEADWSSLFNIFTSILESSSLQTSKQHRVLAMIIVKHVSASTPVMKHLDLTSSAIGKWCLQSLRSSLRELRIAAGQALPNFLRLKSQASSQLQRENRVVALEFLRALNDANEPRFCETLILALGHVAQVCGEDELNIILLILIDYLGHQNPLVCSIANLEIRHLAELSNTTVENLLRPFMRTIAVSLVQDLLTRPQKIQEMSELFGKTVNQLLLQTQTLTIPYLVLWKRNEILQKIANASGKGSTVYDLCTNSQNLPALLSLLITENPQSVESALKDFLGHASEKFEDVDVMDLVKFEPYKVACEILEIAGGEQDPAKAKAIEGFRNFASIVERRNQQLRSSSSQSRFVSVFFVDHALGIMAAFADKIDSTYQPMSEKKRCLLGLETLISTARNDISIALPQVRACLQSALSYADLRDLAFSAWFALLSTLEAEEELETIIEHTFIAIVQNWGALSSEIQQKAYDAMTILFENHGALIQSIVECLPSLSSIPVLSKFESQLESLKAHLKTDTDKMLQAFSRRCKSENSFVVLQALQELFPFLVANQDGMQVSATAEQTSPATAEIIRALLDVVVRFNDSDKIASDLSAKCLGIFGCVDPNRVELPFREREQMILSTNLESAHEAVDFVATMLEGVLVKAFRSIANPRAQGFLAYVLQELLGFCKFNKEATHPFRPQGSQGDTTYLRWNQMPESVKSTLTPFLTSRYSLKINVSLSSKKSYPIWTSTTKHATWLRDLVIDLLQKANGENAKLIFRVLARIIRGYDISIAIFLLPYAAANVVIGGTESEAAEIILEMLTVLKEPTLGKSKIELDNIRACSDNIFQILDYLSRWLQAKKMIQAQARNLAARSGRPRPDIEENVENSQIQSVERALSAIPADIISQRAVECGSYARALFHWEQFIRQEKSKDVTPSQMNIGKLYERLQDIYAQIDEPDGIEGVSAHLQTIKPAQQALEHQRSGRWAAAQSWYEVQLREDPNRVETATDLLTCLRETGKYHVLLDQTQALPNAVRNSLIIKSIASEAAWRTEKWELLNDVEYERHPSAANFNSSIGIALIHLRNGDKAKFSGVVEAVRSTIAGSLNYSKTSSLQACHKQLLQLQVLNEIENIVGYERSRLMDEVRFHQSLQRGLDVIGTFTAEKQYLLGIRRAAMQCANGKVFAREIADSWIVTAKLARKSNHVNAAYEAILYAARLGDDSFRIEQARLFWKDGEHRKAIQNLEDVIRTSEVDGRFDSNENSLASLSTNQMVATGLTAQPAKHQSILEARAHLLLAKWLDQAGQTSSAALNQQYQLAVSVFVRWEKGLYCLGKFYNKMHDSEKALPPSQQSLKYLTGDAAKLVIENYLRSMMFGCKYLSQTLPKLLTLWLEFGVEAGREISREVSNEIRARATSIRPKTLDTMNSQVFKYGNKVAVYLFYTGLPQMITRISHNNPKVYEILGNLIIRIVMVHPQQALWSLLAVVKSSSLDRARRGTDLLNKLKERKLNIRNSAQNVDLKTLITQGQRLSDGLLHACEVSINGKSSTISLSRDLGFNMRHAPCGLVIPLDKTLSVSLPLLAGIDTDHIRSHKAFPATREAITISSFLDEVLVLSSLQRPRKITVLGTDGQKYGLLCKPNDDLRKDQRLMEFNAMINRSLKKDAESSKRRLYIKTYAVTPLNEACGIIEWVEGLKPMRDIIVQSYRNKGIRVDYNSLRTLLDQSCANPEGWKIFSDQILPKHPPVLHEWFTELFPEPESWFSARLRYTRSCAVASMVGHALGLGDRHGENVLLEESSGGIFHVDFNCLFDKGMTFEKPEVVPFRLTHNMVDAFGAQGVDGPFRKSAELAMKVMRGNKDALLTILETFMYDPTADFVGPRKRHVKGVPETPREVLVSARAKVEGFLHGESVPLSVEGHVDALIRQATDPANLCAMYIGWCAFF